MVHLISAAHVLAKIFTLIAFFIIINNVFTMREGYRNCSSCDPMTSTNIGWCIVFFVYYSIYSMIFVFLFGVSSK